MFDKTLRWSASRYKTYCVCPRQYYYYYYLSDGGWFDTATKDAQLAYQLKKLRPLPMHVGVIMHDAIYRWVVNQLLTIGTLEKETLAVFCNSVSASKRNVTDGKYGNQFIQLSEHYYGMPVKDDMWIAKIYACFKALREVKETLAEILKQQLLTSEEALNFGLKTGAAVTAKLDAAFRSDRDNSLTIIDWKTGKHDPAIRSQMLVYAMAVIKLGWARRPAQITMMPIFLGDPNPSQRISTIQCEMPDLCQQAASIEPEYRMLIDADKHRDQMGFFDAKPQHGANTCSSCSFRKMCPDKRCT